FIGIALAKREGIYLGNLRLNNVLHEVEGDVYVINKNSFYIKNFNYDGNAPDAHFWVGNSKEPSAKGTKVPDEFGSFRPLEKYQNKDIVISLPKNVTFSNIKWLSVWCIQFNANFGYVNVSNFTPPEEVTLSSLVSRAHGVKSGKIILKDSKTIIIHQLYYDGVAPDAYFLVGKDKPNPSGFKVPDENGRQGKIKGYQGKTVTLRLPNNLTWFDLDWFALYCISYRENFGEVSIPKHLNIPIHLSDLSQMQNQIPPLENCYEMIKDHLNVRWKIDGNNIYIQLEGRASVSEYLSFGISGHQDYASMEGADVAVTFYDESESTVKVVDYYLISKAQCSLNDGACPDIRVGGSQNIMLMNSKYRDGILISTYQRPLEAVDTNDKSIEVNKTTTVVAAIGPINSRKEVAKHRLVTRDTIKINFNEDGQEQQQCTPLTSDTTSKPFLKPWPSLKITDETIFKAKIGPTGGNRGYSAITGIPSWGFCWWINGLLIPELTVKRGVTYTFIVEGGNDITNGAKNHPLYITNNKEGGGYQSQDELWTPKHMVYAGLERDGNNTILTGGGRFCEYKLNGVDMSDSFDTFEEYKKTVTLTCDEGNPAVFNWTPNHDTPDIVYYQCYTHRNFGWKIHVVNSTATILLSWNWILFLCIFNIKLFNFYVSIW
ncbi:protein Skeletor, isoforms B/C-like, partial [Centruroides sculpturatus]|uniref:protein Skeletor, isoforms B/C-like n=1 Tax=Centruroides sculpturatus TaxID=218467 RepID=UPI000C6DE162